MFKLIILYIQYHEARYLIQIILFIYCMGIEIKFRYPKILLRKLLNKFIRFISKIFYFFLKKFLIFMRKATG